MHVSLCPSQPSLLRQFSCALLGFVCVTTRWAASLKVRYRRCCRSAIPCPAGQKLPTTPRPAVAARRVSTFQPPGTGLRVLLPYMGAHWVSVFRLNVQCAPLGMAPAEKTILANCASCKDAAVGSTDRQPARGGAPAPSHTYGRTAAPTQLAPYHQDNIQSGFDLNRQLGAILKRYCPFGYCLPSLLPKYNTSYGVSGAR
jgi:hypothetical protein